MSHIAFPDIVDSFRICCSKIKSNNINGMYVLMYSSMFLVGLTGGIASGKSTVSTQLRELGCPIIDADVVARKGVSHIGF